jgi:hypothetical protein
MLPTSLLTVLTIYKVEVVILVSPVRSWNTCVSLSLSLSLSMSVSLSLSLSLSPCGFL